MGDGAEGDGHGCQGRAAAAAVARAAPDAHARLFSVRGVFQQPSWISVQVFEPTAPVGVLWKQPSMRVVRELELEVHLLLSLSVASFSYVQIQSFSRGQVLTQIPKKSTLSSESSGLVGSNPRSAATLRSSAPSGSL